MRLQLCPETTGKTDFDILKFQAFHCRWEKLLLGRAVGKGEEVAVGWGLPVPSSAGTLAAPWRLVSLGSLKGSKGDRGGLRPQAWHVSHGISSCP